MLTECPHCHTVFHVELSDLEKANGKVRCGHCLAVFEADNPYDSVMADDMDSTLDQIDDLGPVVADVIPPELRAESRRGKSRFGFLGTLFLTLLILLSIVAGLLQYAYYNRYQLVKIPELRPWLERACKEAGCDLPPPRDTSQIILSSKNIFTHPNTSGALMISATIVNQAPFAQAFPVIELRFDNVRGQTIAARRFNPQEYLDIPAEQISNMQPDTPVNFKLEIRDPGSDMVSYEFDFL